MTSSHVPIWDLETIPDLAAVARANGLDEVDETAARSAIGKFAKPTDHAIVCIAALLAERTDQGYCVRCIGAPHIGDRSSGS
jgi:3'-5' exonuclease